MSTATNTAASDFCPPFNSDEELNSYLSSIAPPRELICPITQELLKDPVVAEDGHTYERNSLVTWYEMGRTRSPVTNALLENTSTDNLVTNLAVTSLANLHRQKLGKQLIEICVGVKDLSMENDNGGGVGVRVDALLDAGADPNTRGDGANTPLHLLIQARNISLANQLLNHEASVCNTNDAGLDCIATAEQTFSEIRNDNNATIKTEEWNDFIQELKRRETVEKARLEARDRARSQANDEHRERQRTLAANARTNSGDSNRGFGRMGEGVGYFPSLATLQFQSSIPGPSPSVAEYENKEKERLNSILKWMCFIVLVYYLFS